MTEFLRALTRGQADEWLVLLSSLTLIAVILLVVAQAGGVRKLAARQRGSSLILFALLIPESITALYFALLLGAPWFAADLLVRDAVIRSATFTTDVILILYFASLYLEARHPATK